MFFIVNMLKHFLINYSESYKFRFLTHDHLQLINDKSSCNSYLKKKKSLQGIDI